MKKIFHLIIICGILLLIQSPCLLSAEETGDSSVNVSQVFDSQYAAELPTPDKIADDTNIELSHLANSYVAVEQSPSLDTNENVDEPSDYIESDPFEDDYESGEEYAGISDPLEPINRIFFQFNDKLYFWFLKPVSSGYKAVVPKPARIGVKNFFSNLAFPIRFVNCILQAKFEGAGYEVGRFLTNSILGLGGFINVAEKQFNMKAYDEDFGQTLGAYGLGNGFYINWPVLGPSTFRDTIGDAGDYFLDPVYYADLDTTYDISIKGYEKVNDTSLVIGDYEDLKKSAIDPYIAFRDAYFQYRRNKVEK
jgi:phospholipid-binding lipoprotein MlaA